jgi:hypothetical protein
MSDKYKIFKGDEAYFVNLHSAANYADKPSLINVILLSLW